MNDIIKCPKCDKEVEIDIVNSVSEDGEVFVCPHCGYYFRFVDE